MSELRNRIAASQRRVLKRSAFVSDADLPDYLAQAVIDEFELTTNGEHGYVEIWGCYDTRFED